MTMQGFDPNFELIRQALGTIEFFREIHGSSKICEENIAACTGGLRLRADSLRPSNPEAAALFENVTEGIERYVGVKPPPAAATAGAALGYQKRMDEGGGGPANTPPDKVTKVPGA